MDRGAGGVRSGLPGRADCPAPANTSGRRSRPRPSRPGARSRRGRPREPPPPAADPRARKAGVPSLAPWRQSKAIARSVAQMLYGSVARKRSNGVRDDAPSWYLLIHQLPPEPLYLRAKIRQRLAKVGAVALKNAVYALPRSEDC